MKAIKVLLISTILFTISTNAQITKGNWMVGGNGSFSYSKTESKEQTSSGTNIQYTPLGSYLILLEPNFGYFFRNRFAAGIKLNYLNVFTEGTPFRLKDSNIGFSPYIRYYFLDSQKNYNFFIEPSYFQYLNNALGNSNGYSIKAGHVIFLNSSVGFETTLNYVSNESSSFKRKEVFLGLGVQIHLEKE